MPVGCNKLRKVLMDKKKNRTELKDITEISFNVHTKMVGMSWFSMKSPHKICQTVSCDMGDGVDG